MGFFCKAEGGIIIRGGEQCGIHNDLSLCILDRGASANKLTPHLSFVTSILEGIVQEVSSRIRKSFLIRSPHPVSYVDSSSILHDDRFLRRPFKLAFTTLAKTCQRVSLLDTAA